MLVMRSLQGGPHASSHEHRPGMSMIDICARRHCPVRSTMCTQVWCNKAEVLDFDPACLSQLADQLNLPGSRRLKDKPKELHNTYIDVVDSHPS